MDAARGFAILGILWFNIFLFALPFEAIIIPGIWGTLNTLNIFTWDFVSTAVSGVMRGMITIIFGATSLILLRRVEQAEDKLRQADLYFRRLLWLILFGLVHSYLLLWPHDVLYVYGILGMLLFPFRNLETRHLGMLAAVLFACSMFFTAHNHEEIQNAEAALGEAVSETEIIELREDDPLLEELEALAEEIAGETGDTIPNQQHGGQEDGGQSAEPSPETDSLAGEDADFDAIIQMIAEGIDARQGSYLSVMRALAPEAFVEQTSEMLTNHLWDVVAFFLVGMVLLRVGFFYGEWPVGKYLGWGLACYSVGLFVSYLNIGYFEEGTPLYNFSVAIGEYTYDLRRLSLAIGNFCLLAVMIKRNIAQRFVNGLTACGRVALSLYILQTIVCNFLFLDFGFGMFGRLEHYEIMAIAIGFTVFQILAASVYLKHYRQGPLEWLLARLVNWPAREKLKTA